MQTLSITKIDLTPTPSGDTICTFGYRVHGSGAFTIVTTTLVVHPDGTLGTPIDLSLEDATQYDLMASPNCSGAQFIETVDTGTGTTSTTTAAPTTTTTTAATTTTTTTAAPTTTTTTSGTTTTTTTAAPMFGLIAHKENKLDVVQITVVDNTAGTPGTVYTLDPTVQDDSWLNVFDPTHDYGIYVDVTPSGRSTAEISVFNNITLATCPACTHVEDISFSTSFDVNVQVGL